MDFDLQRMLVMKEKKKKNLFPITSTSTFTMGSSPIGECWHMPLSEGSLWQSAQVSLSDLCSLSSVPGSRSFRQDV